jgi:hypothetical protein
MEHLEAQNRAADSLTPPSHIPDNDQLGQHMQCNKTERKEYIKIYVAFSPQANYTD